MPAQFPSSIKIVEVGARDGLQNEQTYVETADKFEYIRLLKESGEKTIEVTSFVSPKAIPQMRDAKKLYSLVKENLQGLSLPCLVPNMKGFDAAMEVGVQEIALFTATSNSFNKKNINSTTEESLKRIQDIARVARAKGIKMRGYISTAFGCPYEGETSKELLLEITQRLIELGVYEVSIGDTVGVATPIQVDEFLRFINGKVSFEKLAMHFHDTRAMALTNIYVSLQHGIAIFDSSSGGLGGCPYAKGASGNVATEDLLYLCQSLNIQTNIDMDKLAAASRFILKVLHKDTSSKFLQSYFKGLDV